jgi:hypothetical protein
MTKNTLVKSTFFATNDDGKVLAISDLAKSGNDSRISFTFKASEKKVFVDATLESNITSEIGSLNGVVQRYGGFVVKL